ncbi:MULTISPECIES: aldose 1-epimerase family protein [Nonomuraea]|uniref:Aldose 1-epimerase family protein n=1 Tax=Nonomuraea mangrovi TaxID=2316207 RepID=A0ABW4SUF0_9ACTN
MPTLSGAGYTAEISTRGAAVRGLRHGARELLTSWPEGGPVPYFAGTLLAPWPNRVGGAVYTFAGERHELPVNEPGRGHALHGLVHAAEWRVDEEHGSRVRLAYDLAPSPGYPFTLSFLVTHALGERGLTTTVSCGNSGERAAPYGCGPHPWLLGGRLHVPAEKVLLPDERMLPRSLEEVAGTPYDFRQPRELGDTPLDHTFTGLSSGEVAVDDITVSWDPAVMPWVQVCTGTHLGYTGVAVEPMTFPPDAFNSGADLVVLEPGDEHEASWTIGVR